MIKLSHVEICNLFWPPTIRSPAQIQVHWLKSLHSTSSNRGASSRVGKLAIQNRKRADSKMLIPFILLVVTSYLIFSLLKLTRPKNYPPGPPNYPIVGASTYIASLGKTSSEAFAKLCEIYGPLTGLFLGNNRALIINGYEASKEFYSRDEFPHRPYLYLVGYRWGGKMLGVFFSNGRLWQEQRRFTLRHLRDFGFGKTSMEGLIHEEAEDLIGSLKKAIKEAGPSSVINVDDKFGVSVINILWAIMAGQRYKHDDAEFRKMLKKIFESFRAGRPSLNLVNAYPFLRHLPYFKQEFELLISGSNEIYKMLEGTIADHKKTRESESTPRDLIDVYLDAMKENATDPNTTFSMEQLMQICQDLFAAGSESTSNSIAYAVLHMLRNPECQEKVQKELDDVIGREQFASYNDKSRLPYTYAAVTESFRMSPVAPVSVPHYNTEDAKLMGYDIPKGTWVVVNFPSTNMDKKYWGDPENFRPERFLDENGQFITSKLDHVMGFGAGKRQCLGEPLARISNFAIFTAVMQHFKFELVPGMPKPPIDPIEGFTIAPMPFKAKVTVRSTEML